MVTARKERKWKQAELAEKVERHVKHALSATQSLISQIESGEIVTSRLIRPISELLAIPEPMHFVDETMKRWWVAGHLMRAKQMKLFEHQLGVVESMLNALNNSADDEDDAKAPARTTEKPSRK